MNYLELVNNAVYESKVVLEPLTSVNFANPPRTTMYTRFKNWVNDAYLELLNEKPEWFFTSERGVVTVQPRLRLVGLDHATTLAALQSGDIITGQESGVIFTINSLNAVIEPGDVPNYSTTANVTYNPATSQNDLLLNEKFSMKRGVSPVVTGFGRIGGRGRYDFKDAITTLDTMLEGTISIQPAVDITVNPSPTDLLPVYPVNFLPWERWVGRYDSFALSAGRPIAVTQAPDGTFEFYPRPDDYYDVSFTYSQKGAAMSLYSDLPVLVPVKYHKILVWAAVLKLADFNNDPGLYSRAKKEYDRYLRWMVRDLLPKPTLFLARFDNEAYGKLI